MVKIEFDNKGPEFARPTYEVGQILRALATVADTARGEGIDFPILARDGRRIGKMTVTND